jgi:hypothetical protein
VDVAQGELRAGTGPTGRLVWRSPWDKIEVSQTFGARRWGVEYATTRGSLDPLRFVAAHLMHMTDATQADVLSGLETITEEFETLLARPSREEDIQAFLSEHPVLLSPTAANVFPKHRLGERFVCDFAVERAERDYVLVEIEPATHPLFTRQANPSHQLSHAQQQVEDWREWVTQHVAYAQQTLPGISDPDCWIILGRSDTLSGSDRVRLGRRNRELPHITIMTYDDLLSRARRYVDNLRAVA